MTKEAQKEQSVIVKIVLYVLPFLLTGVFTYATVATTTNMKVEELSKNKVENAEYAVTKNTVDTLKTDLKDIKTKIDNIYALLLASRSKG